MKEYIEINGKKFKFNEKENAYGTIIEANDKKILVMASLIYCKDKIEETLEKASNYIDNLDIKILKKVIVDNGYYNQTELNISQEEFLNQIYLKYIFVSPSIVEYWFDDNNLYGGHEITVSKFHDSEIYNVNLAG